MATLKTLWAEWRNARAERRLGRLFHGCWRTAAGVRLEIAPRRVKLRTGDGLLELSPATCGFSQFCFHLAEQPPGAGHYYRAGLLTGYRRMPEGMRPMLVHACTSGDASFVLDEPSRLLAVLYDGRRLCFTR
jgi:hypothetical protein